MGGSDNLFFTGLPASSNTISAGPSYKTLALMKEYSKLLASGAKSWKVFPDFEIEEVPFYTPTPRQLPIPVMPERLT